ncbi:unnamed protein product [Prunus armeniaca]|uniref:Uncharacterized protein n=1 Tax=Prunus armeniaca TaxID=36596 RepID=A0A6J5TM12_PRUAR|nr:unnamed protein product [Prunus armeniaca]
MAMECFKFGPKGSAHEEVRQGSKKSWEHILTLARPLPNGKGQLETYVSIPLFGKTRAQEGLVIHAIRQASQKGFGSWFRQGAWRGHVELGQVLG